MRRLLGWLDAERDVLRPTVPARGRGTRRRFTRGDILQVAIVAELQVVFGSANLRPCVLASEVAAWLKTIDPARLRAARPTANTDPGVVLFSVRDGRIVVNPQPASNAHVHLRRHGITVAVNYDYILRRIDEVLATVA